MYRSACFSSSPTRSTTEVVPSPQMSSCAVAALAIMTAVGCCICISRRSTFPSLVSLIYSASHQYRAIHRHEHPSSQIPVQHHRQACNHRLVSTLELPFQRDEDDSYILMVPKGPRFDFSTSCKPSPALMLTRRASPRRCKHGVSPENGDSWERGEDGNRAVLLTRLSDSEAARQTCRRVSVTVGLC